MWVLKRDWLWTDELLNGCDTAFRVQLIDVVNGEEVVDIVGVVIP